MSNIKRMKAGEMVTVTFFWIRRDHQKLRRSRRRSTERRLAGPDLLGYFRLTSTADMRKCRLFSCQTWETSAEFPAFSAKTYPLALDPPRQTSLKTKTDP